MPNADGEKGDIYQVKVIEASSPLTKIPTTPFRLSALALVEVDYCKNGEVMESEPLDDNASKYPILNYVKGMKCSVILDKYYVSGEVGKEFVLQVDHGDNRNFFDSYTVAVEYLNIVKIKGTENEIRVKLLKEYYGDITIMVNYSNCLTCPLSVELDVEEIDVPIEPEEPVEPPVEPPVDPEEPPVEPEKPKEPNHPGIRWKDLDCSNAVVRSNGYTIYRIGKDDGRRMYMKFDTYTVPDTIFIVRGAPFVSQSTLMYSAYLTMDKSNMWYYFDLGHTGEEIYMAVNNPDKIEVFTNYEFTLTCDDESSKIDLTDAIPMPNDGEYDEGSLDEFM